jgi:glycerate kinase
MKRIILAPDSFKGTMSSIKICNIMEEAINRFFPETEVVKIPVADGGEGTVDTFLEAVGGRKINVEVCNPFFEKINSFYGILPDNNTAVIEMAAAAGLPLVQYRKDPKATTTYGVGQLILDAISKGCRKIIIGLGGSSTNDGGAGMAAALGVKFFDAQDNEFVPVGGTLKDINRIDTKNLCSELAECEIIGMCDVDNPLYGEKGAAHIFGPQKGADQATVAFLDNNLKHLSVLIENQLNKNVAEVPGAGAAGGLGAGIMAFLNGKLHSGIETVLDTVGFDHTLQGTDLVFTGEGKIDGQSLRGKVVVGVARRAKKNNIPVIAVVGDIGDDIDDIYTLGVTAIVSINRVAIPFEQAATRSERDMADTMDTIMRLLKLRIGIY